MKVDTQPLYIQYRISQSKGIYGHCIRIPSRNCTGSHIHFQHETGVQGDIPYDRDSLPVKYLELNFSKAPLS